MHKYMYNIQGFLHFNEVGTVVWSRWIVFLVCKFLKINSSLSLLWDTWVVGGAGYLKHFYRA